MEKRVLYSNDKDNRKFEGSKYTFLELQIIQKIDNFKKPDKVYRSSIEF
jgi:hypothetical protein